MQITSYARNYSTFQRVTLSVSSASASSMSSKLHTARKSAMLSHRHQLCDPASSTADQRGSSPEASMQYLQSRWVYTAIRMALRYDSTTVVARMFCAISFCPANLDTEDAPLALRLMTVRPRTACCQTPRCHPPRGYLTIRATTCG